MNEPQKVGPGMFVAYSYKLYNDADGKLLFETPAKAPDYLIFGVSQDVIPGLAAAMEGLSAGDKFEVTLPEEAAFGPRNEEYVMDLDKNLFEKKGKLAEEVKVGAMLPMMTAEGYRVTGTVKEIGDSKIKMDFNHPFAGLTVTYKGIIDEVRHATQDELNPPKGCGGGCGGCGGGCGDGGCDSGSCNTGCGGCH